MLHVKRQHQDPEQMTLEQVNGLLQAGELSGEELGWQAGMAEWAPILTISGVVSPTPPPLPPDVPPPIRRQVQSVAPPIALSRTTEPKKIVFNPLSLPPASQYRRVCAFFLDYGLLMYGIIAIEDALGGSTSEYSTGVALVVGGAYLLLKDSLFRGASLGKLIFRLLVVESHSGQPCGIMRSCRRNGVIVVTIGVACFSAWIFSLLVGPVVASKAGAAAVLVAAVYPFIGFGSPDRRTTSDVFAGTYVLNAQSYYDALQPNNSTV